MQERAYRAAAALFIFAVVTFVAARWYLFTAVAQERANEESAARTEADGAGHIAADSVAWARAIIGTMLATSWRQITAPQRTSEARKRTQEGAKEETPRPPPSATGRRRDVFPWWLSYYQLTTWNHAASVVFFGILATLGHLPAARRATLTPTVVAVFLSLNATVALGRASYTGEEANGSKSVLAWFGDVVTHVVLPGAAVVWIGLAKPLANYGPLRFRDFSASLVVWLGLIGTWLVVNLSLRWARGAWVYGPDAADPTTPKGRVQLGLAGLGALALWFGSVWFILFTRKHTNDMGPQRWAA